MIRADSQLLAPHRALGLVCIGMVKCCYQPFVARRHRGELSCVVDNTVHTYILQPLRLKWVSNPLVEVEGIGGATEEGGGKESAGVIRALARDAYRIFAVVGSSKVVVMSRMGEIFMKLSVDKPIKFLLPFGEALVVVDEESRITVFDLQQTGLAEPSPVVEIESPSSFSASAIVHPATYVDQVVLGGSDGRMRLINITSGELVREYPADGRDFNAPITVLEQSPAVDVLAIGLANGQIHLKNIRVNQTICSFRQEGLITAISFRSDGIDSMVSSNSTGSIAVWDLNERMLVGQKPDAHAGAAVLSLHFMLGQPYLISTGSDNRVVKWVLKGENSLPEVHTAMEGHAAPVHCVSFFNECSLLSAGEDGCVRQFDSIHQNVLKSYGPAREVKKQELSKDRFLDVRLGAAVELGVSAARESVWDNVLCRHANSPLVSTWSTRRCTRGSHLLYHRRFKHNPRYISAEATSMFLSACGNFALIGYSSGHLDAFHMQSGKWRNTFWAHMDQNAAEQQNNLATVPNQEDDEEDDKLAHSSAVTGVAMDLANHTVVSGSADGYIHFWQFNPPPVRLYSRVKVGKPIVKFRLDPLNSLLAVGLANGELLVVDVLCRRVARRFADAHKKANRITALEFSPDGMWLMSADDCGKLKIWNLSTSSLMDVMDCSSPCLDASFSEGGEYLATVHKGQRGVYLWANKALFHTGTSYAATRNPPPMITIKVDEDEVEEDDEKMDADDNERMEVGSGTSHPKGHHVPPLLTLSGLPAPRWASLPIIDLLRQRNKPVEPPKKQKAAPFFLPTTDSLEGFAFDRVATTEEAESGEKQQGSGGEEEAGSENQPKVKQLLSSRTPWVQSLMSANKEDQDALKACFASLTEMGPSAIDFQIRSMDSEEEVLHFVLLLCAVLESHKDFELVQSYMAALFNVHRELLWKRSRRREGVDEDEIKEEEGTEGEGDEEMPDSGDGINSTQMERDGRGSDKLQQALERLLAMQEAVWTEVQELLDSNTSLAQWIKSAVI